MNKKETPSLNSNKKNNNNTNTATLGYSQTHKKTFFNINSNKK